MRIGGLTVERLMSMVISTAFLLSGFSHLLNPYLFLSSVYSYELTGPSLGKIVAMFAPWTQITIALFLFARVCVPGALLLAAGLLGIYSFAQSYAMWYDLDITCGCFGPGSESTVSYQTLGLVLALLGCAIVGLIIQGIDQADRC